MKTKIKNFNIFQIIQLIYFKIRTLLIFKNARLIRFPIDIRGKKYMSVTNGFTTGFGCRIESYPEGNYKTLFIGEDFQMNDYVHITAMKSVIIGKHVLLASKVYISDCSHGNYNGHEKHSSPLEIPKNRKMYAKPVVIGDNVWLGEFVSVLPGVKIGKGTIVGANSVVSRDLPDNVIAVGSPARPIKKYNFETNKWEIIQ